MYKVYFGYREKGIYTNIRGYVDICYEATWYFCSVISNGQITAANKP